jgi:hypothetical protein
LSAAVSVRVCDSGAPPEAGRNDGATVTGNPSGFRIAVASNANMPNTPFLPFVA